MALIKCKNNKLAAQPTPCAWVGIELPYEKFLLDPPAHVDDFLYPFLKDAPFCTLPTPIFKNDERQKLNEI